MNQIIAIDPGTTESAMVIWDGKTQKSYFAQNRMILDSIRARGENSRLLPTNERPTLAIEMVACYGMAVGKSVFETVVWIGRFVEAWEHETMLTPRLVTRPQIKIHHCKSSKAKDANVRQALIDKYGEVGTKKKPGMLFGISNHKWAAFALASFISETALGEQPIAPAPSHDLFPKKRLLTILAE